MRLSQILLRLSFLLASGAVLVAGLGCTEEPTPSASSGASAASTPVAETSDLATLARAETGLLAESWQAYRQRFIQADGRVIDWESNNRTVSEGQAYAMLRAVLIDDPATFEQTLQWAENNLRRSPLPNDADGTDHLWAWKWGERPDGSWGIQDANFASDADIDAITALILADKRWRRPEYLDLARKKLADLWTQSTLTLPAVESTATLHYLLPGPLAAFQPQPGKIYLNPSYFAPYAFRLFATVDDQPQHDWMALVDSSYAILHQTKTLSPPGLPLDWVMLDLAKQTIEVAPDSAPLQSRYGFDAYRVWWRVAWDAAIFQEARAQQFLSSHLAYLQTLWQSQEQIPAVLSPAGQPLVDYEATAQYAMLYPAWQTVDPAIAEALYRRKLLTSYQQGIWDSRDVYYVQNLAWLGLFPLTELRQLF
ncbi:MAG: glycosyl hydrolase family 8 [Almyronema sp.]